MAASPFHTVKEAQRFSFPLKKELVLHPQCSIIKRQSCRHKTVSQEPSLKRQAHRSRVSSDSLTGAESQDTVSQAQSLKRQSHRRRVSRDSLTGAESQETVSQAQSLKTRDSLTGAESQKTVSQAQSLKIQSHRRRLKRQSHRRRVSCRVSRDSLTGAE